MNPRGKNHEDIDGMADTEMAVSSGAAFQRTEPGERLPSNGSGTLTDMSHGPAKKRVPVDIQRDGRYEVEGEHARGGLGRVLRARDEHLGRTVAIKELLEANTFAESLFIREALITARLQHPGIVPVHEAGRWPSGDPYYVMKLLSGESMRKLIRKKKTLAERIELLPHVLDVVETIAYAHSQGIIHRDIKPANVMVGEFGETVVVDWGLARDDRDPVPPVPTMPRGGPSVDVPAPSSNGSSAAPTPNRLHARPALGDEWLVSGNYSVSGKVVGTPAYMSPEQARGMDVDERTDVYALGALMYEVLSGKPPYPGEKLQEILENVLAGPPRPLAERLAESGEEIQPDLITMVERAMARDREERYPTAKELAEDLKRFQAGQLVSVHHYKIFTLIKRWARRNRAPLFVAAAAVVVLAVFGVFSIDRIVEQKNVAEAQRAEAQAARDEAQDSFYKQLMAQAERGLHTDPTSTLAYLSRIPLDKGNLAKALELTEQAVAMGVSRHVLEHDETATGLSFTPDGQQLLVGDMSGRLFAVDVASGTERVVARTDDNFAMVAVAPDSDLVALTTRGGRVSLIRLGDEAPGSETVLLPSSPDKVKELWFSDEGDTLHAIDRGQQTRTWRIPGGELVSTTTHAFGDGQVAWPFTFDKGPGDNQVVLANLEGHEAHPVRFDVPARIKDVAADRHGRRAVVSTADDRVFLLETSTREVTELGGLDAPHERVGFPALVLSPSGRYLALRGSLGGTVHLWDLDRRSERALVGHRDTVFNMIFSADERYLITPSDDTTVRIWDLHTSDVQVARGHTDDVYRVAVSRDGKTIASASRDRTIRVWPVTQPEAERFAYPGYPMAVVGFDGPESIVVIGHDGAISRRDLAAGVEHPVGQASFHLVHRERSLSPGRRFALAADETGRVELWDVRNGTHRAFDSGFERKPAGLAWAPDSSGVALMDADNAVRFWPIDGDGSAILPADETRCGIALSPGSTHLALIHENALKVVDTATMQEIVTTPIDARRSCRLADAKMHAAYAPDGKKLAIPYPRLGMLVWDTSAHTFETYPVSPLGGMLVRFSDDSSRIASFHMDLSIHLVDLGNKSSRLLGYHDDIVFGLEFSPRGDILASNSYDNTIRLWDLRGDDHRVLRGHSAAVGSVGFSPDGTRLVSVSMDRTLRIWDLTRVLASDGPSLRAFLEGQTTATVDHSNVARTPRHRE